MATVAPPLFSTDAGVRDEIAKVISIVANPA